MWVSDHALCIVVCLLFASLLLDARQKQSVETFTLLELVDRQNLALADALRVADVLRDMAAKQRKTFARVEGARAGLRRDSKSTGELDMC